VNSKSDFIYELPFEPGARFLVSQGYGGAYSHHGKSHFSLDFRMPEGSRICAARGGLVFRVVDHFEEGGTHPSFKPKANVIDVLHFDDTIASYAHLQKRGALVLPGQFVTVGQPIGLSGNTGWSGHPHLHFHVASALCHERIPTTFNTESGPLVLEPDNWYERPRSSYGHGATIKTSARRYESRDRDPFAFSADLLNCRIELIDHLSDAGFDLGSEYSSVDLLHDVHGLEVCGIHNADDALEVTRILLRVFLGWNAGWLNAPEWHSEQEWVASIMRDRDLVIEEWNAD
jgi:hypothetical protein